MRVIMARPSEHGRTYGIEEVAKPEPRSGQLLVKVDAIGINGGDIRGGATDPYVPGLDIGGTVDAVGADIPGWNVGDPIIALVRGAYAEFCPARPSLAYRPPAGMAIEDAASIPCVYLTAWYALIKTGALKAGENVLIHAAGGGVGSAAVQVARAWGARVIASAGSDEKLERARELGADAVVNYSTQDVEAELMRLTGGRGADVVLDPVGGTIFDATLRSLANGGRVTTIGGTSGERSAFDEAALLAKGQKVQAMGAFPEALADTEQDGYRQLIAWFEDGTLRPIVQQVFSWSRVEEALELLRSRSVFGKLVMSVER